MPLDNQGRAIEFGRTADDYDRHRPGFPAAFRQRLLEKRWALPGQRALDLGTGTGTVALSLAECGLDVVGIDPSEELLARARQRASTAGLKIRFERATAEDTQEAEGSFDVVAAGQCWWWFDSDRALAEARRVLTAEGRLIIASFCYVPTPGSVAALTEQLILEFNPSWGMAGLTGIFESHVRDLDRAGFDEVESVSWVEPVVFTHEGWRGRMRACNGVGAVLGAEDTARFDASLAELLASRFPEPLRIPHRVFIATGRG
ncbi:MAG: methyltransferase domain-containing protein [Myxococcales bacterium]|nr:methyltransferase domain-containing protein [Myxococcales bacterium]